MNILSGFNYFKQNPGDRIRILLHGNLIHCFNKKPTVTEFTRDAIRKAVDRTSRPILFLASPYIHTFIHETIHLSKKEMEEADQRLLGFKVPASKFINITSLEINEKKSMLIHSHLTREGTELLTVLQREKLNFTWHPAILSLITNLHKVGTKPLVANDKLRIYLADEMLQLQKQGGIFRFQHLNYLQNHQTFEEKRQTIDQFIDNEKSNHDFSKISFTLHNSSDPESVKHLTDHFIIAPKNGRHLKTVTRSFKKRSVLFQTILRRNSLLGFATAIIIGWAVLLNLYVGRVNHQRQALKQSIAILQIQSDRLDQIAKMERDHFRFKSIMKSVQSLKIQPVLFLEILDQILPKSVWIGNISFQSHRIGMELLDSRETELSAFMDLLGKQSGEANLKNNETITQNDIKIRKYSIEINHLKPQTLHEKLD